jgi:hypothetical protein
MVISIGYMILYCLPVGAINWGGGTGTKRDIYMNDPKDPTFVSIQTIHESDQGLEQRVKSNARLTESGV